MHDTNRVFVYSPLDFLDSFGGEIVHQFSIKELLNCRGFELDHKCKIVEEISRNEHITSVEKHAQHKFKAPEVLVSNRQVQW